MGRATKLTYDNIGRLTEVQDPLKGISKQSYDEDGNISSMTDPNNNDTTFNYDLLGNLISQTTSIGSTITYGYNENNLLEEITNARGQKTVYEHDAAGRITKIKFLEDTVSYTYDENNNILTVGDEKGTIKREYDALNRVTKYIDARGKVVGYDYDALGNLISITYPNGKKVYYEYNKSNNLVKVTDWLGRATKYEYNENGQLSKTIRANGTIETLTYDVAAQLLEVIDKDKNGNIINKYSFDYDKNGNVIKEDKNQSSISYNENDITMTYDKSNRLATFNGQKVLYDADGNMIKVPLKDEMINLTYDSRNRLISAGTITYIYDAENNRIGINENGKGTNYTVNALGRLSQVLVSTDSEGKETYYIYGLGLIAQEDSQGKYRTYHYDRRGSTTAITDEEGKVTDRIEYGPYGEIIQKTGTTKTPFLFNGRYGVMTDSNGLYYMRARYYNPYIKRFINQDVVLGNIRNGITMNRYAYANGNPISNIEPFGLSADGDNIHKLLDIAGLIPGIGVIFDGANALYYTYQGDYVNAALSTISALPIGDLIGKGFKWGKEAMETGLGFFKYSDESVEVVTHNGRRVYSEIVEETIEKVEKTDDFITDSGRMVYEGTGKADNIPGRGYHKEVYANKPVKVTDAVDKWDEFLGPGEYTDIHPRTGLKDPDRIFSADGKRSIRFGSHEMNSKPSKFHYHEEIWTYDPINNVMNVDNTVVRVPYKN